MWCERGDVKGKCDIEMYISAGRRVIKKGRNNANCGPAGNKIDEKRENWILVMSGAGIEAPCNIGKMAQHSC